MSQLNRIKNEDFYYDLAESTGGWSDPYSQRVLKFICNKIPLNGAMAEIGCGQASILGYIREDINYLGIDISEFAIEKARKSFKDRSNTEFKISEAHKLDIESSKYDFILSIHALEHFRNPRQSLDEMVRILKPEGHILLIGPNLDLFISLPNSVRHYGKLGRIKLRFIRFIDYLRRPFGSYAFRTIDNPYSDVFELYEKPDDDLRYILSSYEVVNYLKSKGLKEVKEENIINRTNAGFVKKIIKILPGMKYYGSGLTVILKK